jgi:hypothetical protein
MLFVSYYFAYRAAEKRLDEIVSAAQTTELNLPNFTQAAADLVAREEQYQNYLLNPPLVTTPN